MPLFTRHRDGSFRSHNCTIVGDVTIGEHSSFWFNTVVRGDVAPVIIGKRSNVQDNACVHCDSGVPNIIGDDVVIGHGAIVHGKAVGDDSLIGMGATVLSRVVIGKGCLIAAGAVAAWGYADRPVVRRGNDCKSGARARTGTPRGSGEPTALCLTTAPGTQARMDCFGSENADVGMRV